MDKSISHISNHFSATKQILLPSIALLAGGLIYLLFRPVEALFFNWFELSKFETWISAIRKETLSIYHLLPQWIVYYLPSGLWAFAYTLVVLLIWRGNNSSLKYFWYLSIPVLVFGFEVLQFTGKLQGTFCLHDILWSAFGIFGASLTESLIRTRNIHKVKIG